MQDSWEALASSLQEAPDMLIVPIEACLSLPFRLPLRNPRLLDEDILSQEVSDFTGEAGDRWWYTWQAVQSGDCVMGMVFGMPIEGKEALSKVPNWDRCKRVQIDASLRLHSHLPDATDATFAVLDADNQGVFLGVFSQGTWQGMRRLNLVGEKRPADLREDVVRSLLAMGFEKGKSKVCGRLDPEWLSVLRDDIGEWRGEVVDALLDRHEATLLLAPVAEGVDFRRGAWMPASTGKAVILRWRRSLVLLCLLFLVGFAKDAYTLHTLEKQEESLRNAILAAFHRGLPDEKVIVDPLAQLRQRAGVNVRWGNESFFKQLQAIGAVKRKWKGLRILEIEWNPEGVTLVGEVSNLSTAGKIQAALAKATGHNVRLMDTEMKERGIRFRMVWR